MKFNSQCSECSLDTSNIVYGRGNGNSPLIAFVGEAPGKEEVKEGAPFVGMAGRIIRGILEHLQIPEEETYFTNVCLCRPPENRTPTSKEVKNCYDRLVKELQAVDPVYVIALGATAGKALFPDYSAMNKMRGKVKQTNYGNWGIVTFHPAAVLYNKKDTLLPFIISDVKKIWRKATGQRLTYSQNHTDVKVIRNSVDFKQMVKEIKESGAEVAGFDWETTGVSPIKDRGWCFSLSVKPGEAYVLPVSVVNDNAKELTELLRQLTKGAFNCLFDDDFNLLEGIEVVSDVDPMLMHYCIDERPQQRSLENLSIEYCDAVPYESEMLARYETTKDRMLEDIPEEEVYEYAGKDSDYALRLILEVGAELEKYPSLKKVHDKLLIPATSVIRKMRKNGFYVDTHRLKETSHRYQQDIEKSLETIRDIVGKPDFNPNSHPQVQSFLWDELSLEEPNLYKRKQRSADKDTREALLEIYPDEKFVQELHRYKDLYTLWSRYLRGLWDYLDEDCRIRCQYHLDRTETGRRSTTGPALQQIPRESDIRQVFSAPPGRTLIQADYEQGEIRMAAHIAQDRKLAEYLTAEDFHSQMAAQAYKIPVEEVTKDLRQAAKTVSFGILYQMSIKSLALGTGLSMKEATRFVKEYMALMPNVMKWIDRTKTQVKEQRYVESPFGRRRRFPLITKSNLWGLQREAVNMPIQSGLADLTLWSLIQWHDYCENNIPEALIVFEGHDAILTEVPEDMAYDVAVKKKEIMEEPPFETFVHFPVEAKIGKSWGAGEKVA